MGKGEYIISAEVVDEDTTVIPGQLNHISQVPVGEFWRNLPIAESNSRRLVGLGQVLGIFQAGAAFGYRFAQLEARLAASDAATEEQQLQSPNPPKSS